MQRFQRENKIRVSRVRLRGIRDASAVFESGGSDALGVLFVYLYGFIEHGFIPPAEYLKFRFFNHFAN